MYTWQAASIKIVFIIRQNRQVYNSYRLIKLKKESVEFYAYLNGGSGKPKYKINNTPTLVGIYIGEYMTQQVMNVLAYPCTFEIYQISIQGQKLNTFILNM